MDLGEQSDLESHSNVISKENTAQKAKFSIKGFFSKCDQIHSFLRIWSHLLKKSLMENFIFLCSERGVKIAERRLELAG